jgi:hypothetical protein
MGINVRVESADRSRVPRAEILDVRGDVVQVIEAAWDLGRETYPFLTSIDRYGDTLFNYLMLELLLQEISNLGATVPALSKVLAQLRELAQQVTEEPSSRRFLAFIGD